MPAYLVAYVAAAAAMLVLDAIWLTQAVPRIYQPAIGPLLADKPNLAVAGIFYLLYVVGIVVFAALPALEARSWMLALGLGALLGLVAYGTYDFTNLATLRGWPLGLSLIDVCWGIVLTAVASLAGYAAASAVTSSPT
jgi:uncharacterized membrane protein